MPSNNDNSDSFCFAVIIGILYIWFMFSWMVAYDTGDQQTKDFLFWDAVTDDPFIAWYMSSDKNDWL